MTGFGSFDNSMSKRVLDLLEANYLRLGETMIERSTVVKFGMSNRGGNDGSSFGIEVVADASVLTDMVIAILAEEICSAKVKCSSKMKPRLRS